MDKIYITPGPPVPLSGVEGLTVRNGARLIWWMLRARLCGAGGWWLAAMTMIVAACGAWVAHALGSLVVLGVVGAALVGFLAGAVVFVAVVQMLVDARRRGRGWLVGYFTDDATQLVCPHRAGGWILSDRLARRRGRGLAADCLAHPERFNRRPTAPRLPERVAINDPQRRATTPQPQKA